MKFFAVMVLAISMLGASVATAGAADSLFWANYNTPTISAANLDGSGSGRDLFTGTEPRGGTVSAPAGLALDPAAGFAYWSNTSSQLTRGSIDSCDVAAICATNLYPLVSGGPPVSGPGGPALDVANGLMYWMNSTGTLVRASLDGSGAVNETVNTAGATALGGGGSGGLAIDKRTNRIYWTNDDFGPGKISWANLDGSGGGDLNTTGANMGRPWGLAIDAAGNRVYWTSYNGSIAGEGSVSWASLDGAGGGDLYTAADPGCGIDGPNGVAIDRTANKIYWANFGGSTLGSANLDGSGGCASISSAGATMAGPDEVAVLKAPVAETAAAISRAPMTVETLTCSAGSWAKDMPEASFYRSVRSFSYQWTKDGATIAGANAVTYTPTSSGAYACAAIAANNAGSTAGPASATLAFKRTVKFASLKLKRKTSGKKRMLTGKLGIRATPSVSATDCSGSVALKLVLKKKTIVSKRVALKYKNRKCSAAITLKVAKKYAGKKVRLTTSIGRSSKLTAAPKRTTVKL
jgi:DNA-binding beta-propeller fold protein YncE